MKYRLIRSKRKTLSVEVTRELEIVVRAPYRTARRGIDAFVAAHTGWIEKQMERQRRRGQARPLPTEEELLRLQEAALATIPERVAYFAERMKLYPSAVKITQARTRFGSCSAKNSLCFSCRLMAYPPEAIDYVVVHELAHIRHKDHQAGFYALVESVLPDYKARRALLKE